MEFTFIIIIVGWFTATCIVSAVVSHIVVVNNQVASYKADEKRVLEIQSLMRPPLSSVQKNDDDDSKGIYEDIRADRIAIGRPRSRKCD